MAKHTDVDGVGDFIIERRFAQDIPGAAFQNIPRRIQQYQDSQHTVNTWEDPDHYVSALETMVKNNELNANHCPFCKSLYEEYQRVRADPDRTDLYAGFVKQMRMNHYMYSVLQDEFPSMASASDAKQFDPQGYTEIT
ncbi:hypothetical protein [Halobellus ordinarius]|uniref:hypothetical protein n=1 Tax=Halobellus ordinarius TaxID=3075120 RepID=UPI0028802418|nr:hypothetical protein [Halobellus sp. ZY16]